MKYILVKWNHLFGDEPVLLYSELDDARREVRRIEVFRDGHQDFASAAESRGLGEIPIPELAEIAADPEFEPSEITKEQFEEMWNNRKKLMT